MESTLLTTLNPSDEANISGGTKVVKYYHKPKKEHEDKEKEDKYKPKKEHEDKKEEDKYKIDLAKLLKLLASLDIKLIVHK
ncbi:hypothetical protein H6G76_15665 [Nostoc sp. FACHB-152]|uniref:hypothetical protein n=1 Tax=unclassified Nostoc TaxID=2593658 RepID=UPI001688DD85|nr:MULTISPECIES: hypothetical protein [unclassified Nostoc]MBD2448564.1 hypothetical protein [Nostoc sp. FACHB-152]MBD2469968.1 hypothetical protein [Nostoc sp. FACHB-145]